MGKLRLVWKVIIILLIGIVTFLIAMKVFDDYFDARKNNDIEIVETNTLKGSDDSEVSVEDENIRNENLTYSAWIPDWSSDSGLESLKKHGDNFNDISPVWYEVEEGGILVKKTPINADSLIEFAREEGIEIIPSIALFDHEIFSNFLNDDELLQKHIDQIILELDEKNYDGIDIDYESTQLDDKEQYFGFLNKLSKEIHRRDKKLVVSVIPKWGG